MKVGKIMELLYLWIYRDNCFYCNEFNFSPEYHICVDDLENPQKIYIEIKSEKVLNIFKQEPILNITSVVGSNGSGKTSLLSYIACNSCIQKFSGEEGYELFQEEEYKDRKSIYVFKDENEEIFVFHNLENDLDTGDYKVFHANGDDDVLTLAELRKQTIVYLSNSLYVNERLEGYSTINPVINYNIHPSSIKLISNSFYRRIFGKGKLENITQNDKEFAWLIYRDSNSFQDILDIAYYSFLLSNDRLREIDTIKIPSIGIKSIWEIEEKYKKEYNEHEKFNRKKTEFLNKYTSIRQDITKNISNLLYYNLLFEIYFYHDINELPSNGIDEIKKSLRDVIDSIKDNKKYNDYYAEIEEFTGITSSLDPYDNLINNNYDMAIRYDRKIDYYSKHNEFRRCVDFVERRYESGNSYVLRYLTIRDNYMSSGERALTNFFSWLVAIPTFDKIMYNTPEENDDESSEGKINNSTTTFNNNYLILIDEIDLYSHPEWQRQIIKVLIDRIGIILKDKKVQIILTTHSPLLLSDFPKSNTIYLYRKENGRSYACNPDARKETFGANIYTILKDAFFLENGAVGEYARLKLLDLSDRLNKGKNSDSDELLINMVGSDIIRSELRKKLIKTKHGMISVIKEEKTSKDKKELLRLQKQLTESLTVINEILNSGDIDD
ncbi:AAA family ATPase [Ruminococcus flavefaciens]|uniref:AAA family ATPase n=1 Tax=Ruminococcus flavefaciens TaxID=1265 RepID=UPI001A9A3C9F|nr:AAA family ATPase [Ruminococcus flavefaciens]